MPGQLHFSFCAHFDWWFIHGRIWFILLQGATGRILIITLAIILIRSHPINREGIDEKITPEALSDSLRLYGAGNPNASTGLDMDVIASTKEAATVAWDEIQTTVSYKSTNLSIKNQLRLRSSSLYKIHIIYSIQTV